MKTIRVIPQCDCEALSGAIFESMLEEGFSPVESRAGIDWVPFDQDQVKIVMNLQKALEQFDPCDIAFVEQVEYVETCDKQDFSNVLSLF